MAVRPPKGNRPVRSTAAAAPPAPPPGGSSGFGSGLGTASASSLVSGPGSLRLYGCSWPWPTMWYLSRGTLWPLVMSQTSLAEFSISLAFHEFCLAKPACSMPTVKPLAL